MEASKEAEGKDELMAQRFNHLISVLGKSHTFWDKMPVQSYIDKGPKNPQMIYRFKKEDVPEKPYKMTDEWGYIETLDTTNDEDMLQICDFLETHYYLDISNKFQVQLTPERLRWTICTPGFDSNLHLVLRSTANKNIVGCIFGMPKNVMVKEEKVKVVDI